MPWSSLPSCGDWAWTRRVRSTTSRRHRCSATAIPSAPSSPSVSEGGSRRMRAVLQRVTSASVTVGGVLVGVTHDDGPEQVEWLARKVADLRLLRDEQSVLDAGAAVLVVSQFTLYGDARKGRRPTWNAA